MALETVDLGAPAAEPVAAAEPWPQPRTAWYAISVFALALMFAQLDLGIMSLLVQPIKRDLRLTDTEMSLLLGLAFVLFYMFIGLPLARFVDTRTRKLILATGITVWSLATAGCGLAQNFWQLFACRVGIGAGESINGPATYSMIADYFPKDRLPRAIAVLQLGFIAGGGMSLLIGAFVIHLLADLGDIPVAGIGIVRNWQVVFFLVGLPGLLVALLMLTVPEPRRRGRVMQGPAKAMPMLLVVRYLLLNWRVFGPMYLGLACSATILAATNLWQAAFFQRTFGWTAPQFGLAAGLLSLLVSPIGLVIGTRLNDRFARAGRDDANMRVLLVAQLVRVPAAILAPLMPNPFLALAFVGVTQASAMIGAPSQNAALQVITPNEMRGQVTALYLFVFTVVGTAVGPTVVALITDYVFASPQQIGYAMALAAGVLGPIGAVTYGLGVAPYGRAAAELRLGGGYRV